MARANEKVISVKNKPKIMILKTDGINCDEELHFAFKLAGGNPKIVHINELRTKQENFKNFQILAIPGGFSYGDDIMSGKVLAAELTSFFSESLKQFIQRKETFTLGICNGFQALIRTGILPFGNITKMDATLTNNDSGHFECRWVKLKIDHNSSCEFLQSMKNSVVSYQVAHGEGKFFTSAKNLEKIEKENLVALRYVEDTEPTQKYPANPNGSLNAIAGITDPTGRVLGLMPHPERFVRVEHHPNWRRNPTREPDGLRFIKQIVAFAKQL